MRREFLGSLCTNVSKCRLGGGVGVGGGGGGGGGGGPRVLHASPSIHVVSIWLRRRRRSGRC